MQVKLDGMHLQLGEIHLSSSEITTAQKMRFSNKDFFSKYDYEYIYEIIFGHSFKRWRQLKHWICLYHY